jgi:hypothetical protein
MSAVLHPVGPREPRVYWVRRLVVVALVVVLVGGGFLVAQALRGVAAGSGDGGEADGGPEPVATGEPTTDTAAEDAAADGPGACAPTDLAVTLTTDARSYAAGTPVVLTVAITNNAATSCTVDAGEASREIVVTSGADRIWSSFDCPAEPAERLLLLPSGARDEVAITWGRTRSAAGCPADQPAPRAGTYTAVAAVAGASSTAAVFDLG